MEEREQAAEGAGGIEQVEAFTRLSAAAGAATAFSAAGGAGGTGFGAATSLAAMVRQLDSLLTFAGGRPSGLGEVLGQVEMLAAAARFGGVPATPDSSLGEVPPEMTAALSQLGLARRPG